MERNKYDMNLFLTTLTDKCNKISEKDNKDRNSDREIREVIELVLSEIQMSDEVLDYIDMDVLETVADIMENERASENVGCELTRDMLLVEKSKELLKDSRTKIIPNTILLF